MKFNDADKVESIEVRLSKEKTPIAYAAKVAELVKDCGMTEQEAENQVDDFVFEMEMYYSPSMGLFMVEAEAIGGGANLVDPYTGKEIEENEN